MRFIILDVEEDIQRFCLETVQMSNADYDLDAVLSEYVEYRKNGSKVMERYYRYGFSDEDREDGRILYNAVDNLYESLSSRLITLTNPVIRAALSDKRTELLVEVQNENIGSRIRDVGRDCKESIV
jgi:hypothetical protein